MPANLHNQNELNIMQPAICLLSVIPMRKEPAHRSEMVSQVLFGEYVTPGEEKDDFVFVKCLYDGYEGWVQTKQLTPITEKELFSSNKYTASFTTPVTRNSTMLQVPYAAPVYQNDGYAFEVAGDKLTYLLLQQQVWDADKLSLSPQILASIYQPFINAPYLWGGKSVFGIDCSGFVQQVFKLLGIKLLRDAYLQAEQGAAVASLPEAQCGDLAFFCNEGGRVTHVGIVLEDNKIVHASGKVRIDTIAKEGIINSENGKRTHTMHSIRRMV
jgi:cell wall-associated NlpC family hydrolase